MGHGPLLMILFLLLVSYEETRLFFDTLDRGWPDSFGKDTRVCALWQLLVCVSISLLRSSRACFSYDDWLSSGLRFDQSHIGLISIVYEYFVSTVFGATRLFYTYLYRNVKNWKDDRAGGS